MEEKQFLGYNGRAIFYRKWAIDEAKAVVQIVHGMAEHSKRYDRFAQILNANGYSVYANDHRGHGYTADSEKGTGYFEGGDFFNETVEDLNIFTEQISKENDGLPIVLLGHSMGSFLSRSYLSKKPNLKAVVLSATAGDPGILGSIGLVLAKIITFLFGKRSRSTLLSVMTFGQYNLPFRPNRTHFDWLTRDESEVDKYVNDPMCGAIFTSNFFKSLVGGLKSIHTKEYFDSVEKNTPILLVSGDKDPVGEDGKGVNQVMELYRNAGVEDVDMKLYENARHEILNETNRTEIMNEIVAWMDSKL